MLDFDLAEMYQIETRVLNQAVKRNSGRFPHDFMFQLTQMEWEDMLSQIVMTSRVKRPKSALPYAFTEQGVAMLSGVLKSDIAIQVNINIMRAFIAMRNQISNVMNSKTLEERIKALEEANEELLKDINDLSEDTRNALDDVFDAFAKLSNEINVSKANPNRKQIGYTSSYYEK